MSTQALRTFIDQHTASAAGLAAVAAALDARASGAALPPAIAARVSEVLGVLGAGDVLDDIGAEAAAAVLAELRSFLLLDHKLLHAHTRTLAWDSSDPEILQAFGGFARNHAQALTRNIVPALDGMAERLGAPGAAFLDIGVGVAGLAIAMAQMWPALRVVGVDVWAPALDLARENVDRANLASRIELREQAGEALADVGAFDLAWVPPPFMAERTIAPTCASTLRALRPGGYVVIAIPNSAALDPVQGAVLRLRMAMCGGPSHKPSELESMLREQGFVEVRTLPGPPGAPVAIIVGRRAV